MPGPSVEAVSKLTEISNLPVSVNDSPIFYTVVLTAMMCGVVMGAYVFLWMMKDLIRDRKYAGFKSVLFNFRLMMGFVGLSGFMACLPEVLYLQMFNDPKVAETTQAVVMMGKRVADTCRMPIMLSWVALLGMIHPFLGLALIEIGENRKVTHLQVEDYPGLNRLWKPALVFVVLAFIAMAFAASKMYGK